VPKLSDEQIAAFKETHKRVAHVVSANQADDGSPEWEIVLRKPSRAEYKMLRSMSHDPNRVADAQEMMVRKLVVHPVPTAFDALLEDFPGIPEACGKALLALAGAAGGEDAK
jgi:hypothetical protein